MFRIRLPRARCCTSSFNKSNRRRNPRGRSSSSSSPSSSDGGGDESGEGGEGAAGRRRGCLAAILGRVLGVVTVDVEAVPAPACRQAGTVGLLGGAVVVVVVVTGRVLVDVTGRGRLGAVVVVTGRVRVDVKGRVWVAVVAGAVPTPATGGRLNKSNASNALTG